MHVDGKIDSSKIIVDANLSSRFCFGRDLGMKLKLEINRGTVAMMAAAVAAGERAVTAAVREAGTDLKSVWRARTTGAGLGTRLASFPKSGESLNAAALTAP